MNAGLNCLASVDGDYWATETKKAVTKYLSEHSCQVFCCDIKLLHDRLFEHSVDEIYLSDYIHTTKKYSFNNDDLDDAVHFFESLKYEDVDLMVGGPPCQGFSPLSQGTKKKLLNRREFIDDPRNQLFKYFLDFVERHKPKFVLIENVSGIISSNGYANLISSSLENTGVGYDVKVVTLDSSYFGVPQMRKRVFFLGVSKRHPNSFAKTFYFESDLISKFEKTINARDAIDDLPVIRSNPKMNNLEIEYEIPFDQTNSFGMTISDKPYRDLIRLTEYNYKINSYRGLYIEPDHLYNHKARYNNKHDLNIYSLLKPGKYLDSNDNIEALKQVKYSTYYTGDDGKKYKGFQDKYFKIDPLKPSRTIVAHMQMDTNGYVHYGDIPRGLTPREAARLQSFPDWYRFIGPFTVQYRQIGNAVPPLLAKKIGEVLKSWVNN